MNFIDAFKTGKKITYQGYSMGPIKENVWVSLFPDPSRLMTIEELFSDDWEVEPEPRKPREFWIKKNDFIHAKGLRYSPVVTGLTNDIDKEWIHVREILPDEK